MEVWDTDPLLDQAQLDSRSSKTLVPSRGVLFLLGVVPSMLLAVVAFVFKDPKAVFFSSNARDNYDLGQFVVVGTGINLCLSVLSSLATVSFFKGQPYRQAQAILVVEGHSLLAMVLTAVAIITAGDFSVMHFRQFAYGISATALALFQMLLMVWTTRMLWREQERIEWVQEQEDMDYEALMTGIIR